MKEKITAKKIIKHLITFIDNIIIGADRWHYILLSFTVSITFISFLGIHLEEVVPKSVLYFSYYLFFMPVIMFIRSIIIKIKCQKSK